jgi:4-hydroxybenzoate polyprenyltransferase
MRFLSIIRYPNLIMLALFQAVIWFYLLEQYQVPKSVSDYIFIVHILATLFIAASGNIINDIYDLEIDQINKPHQIWIPNLMSLKKELGRSILV